MTMVYKNNVNTTKALEAHYAKPVILNSAQKAALRNAAKRSAMYGIAGVTLCSVLILGGVVTTLKVQAFFKENEIVFKLPVEVETRRNSIITIKPITKAKTAVMRVDTLRDKVVSQAKDKTLVQKVYDTFDKRGLDGQKAVAVMYAESGGSCEATNANTNGSVDLGPMQINSVHKNRYKLAEMANCDRNIEIAADLVAEQGWGIFSSVNNRSYLRFMDVEIAAI